MLVFVKAFLSLKWVFKGPKASGGEAEAGFELRISFALAGRQCLNTWQIHLLFASHDLLRMVIELSPWEVVLSIKTRVFVDGRAKGGRNAKASWPSGGSNAGPLPACSHASLAGVSVITPDDQKEDAVPGSFPLKVVEG